MISRPSLPPRQVLVRSLRVSVVVGTALNLINQPEALFGDAPLVMWKVLLTYMVPFLVATYGAITALAAHNRIVHPDD
ncbi:MAG: nitrate/nitrite transporter NrtS [Pseudomonadota bacterium]